MDKPAANKYHIYFRYLTSECSVNIVKSPKSVVYVWTEYLLMFEFGRHEFTHPGILAPIGRNIPHPHFQYSELVLYISKQPTGNRGGSFSVWDGGGGGGVGWVAGQR